MNKKIQIIKNNEGLFQIIDDKEGNLNSSIIQRVLKKFNSYFLDNNKLIFKEEITYVQIENIVNKLNAKLTKKGLNLIDMSSDVEDEIKRKKYYIDEQRDAGLTIKAKDSRWDAELESFSKIIANEISRPLKPDQERASFFLSKMKRAANFSVPGAGKTAMMYGVFAYLSSVAIDKVDKLFVVCPLNAFEAWKKEFVEVFGTKRNLFFMNLKDKRYNDDANIKIDWPNKNVIVINFEALPSRIDLINELLDERTMLVLDEVHRIKGIDGKRAKAALKLNKDVYYRYVLTGTPIPNGYKDVYNFLNILYPDEYATFFNWETNELNNIDVDEVNKKISPFFWRTNKLDLNVPKADDDILIEVAPSNAQKQLAEKIHKIETNTLSRYIRLIQASTNPSLLNKHINYSDLGLIDGESHQWDKSKGRIQEIENIGKNHYTTLPLNNISSPKFNKGIELIKQLISEGKKVLVWGMFVDTMYKIKSALLDNGIASQLVYGGTPKEDREDMIDEFRSGDIPVLISNPNTLGESVSLHQTVHDAIYFEYNFNLTFMLQSRDRIHRLGLPKNQYTRYYYLMTSGTIAESGYIDHSIYNKLKEKEKIMLDAIEGDLLVPEYTTDYLDEVKQIIEDE